MNSLWHRLGWSRSDETDANGRSPQLDGLRGIAILAVVFHHAQVHPPHFLDWGSFGVRLFFVMSAFLITGSLWRLGESTEDNRASFFRGLQGFHLRRFARLLPAYVAALCFGALVGLEEVRESLFWHLGFLSNFNFAILGWFPAATGQFWSLAVQEQFYVVWPFVLLAVPFRWFPWAVLVLVGSGYGFRLWCLETGVPHLWSWVMLPGWLDTFAIGGLVAWLKKQHGLPSPPSGTISFLVVAGGVLALWIANRGIRLFPGVPWLDAGPDLLESIVAASFVWVAVTGIRGPVGVVLEFQPLRFLGGISYGVFVYHLFVLHVMESWLSPHGIDCKTQPWAMALIVLVITVPLAAVSWRWLELPVIRAAKTKLNSSKPALPVGRKK